MRGHSRPTCGWLLMATYGGFSGGFSTNMTRGDAGEFSKGYYGGQGTLDKQGDPQLTCRHHVGRQDQPCYANHHTCIQGHSNDNHC
jgi:hypothetical protein